jgi:hypothetical protein
MLHRAVATMDSVSLKERLILIVESDLDLVRYLVRALEEDERAQTASVSDPYCDRVAERLRKFAWSAAVINSKYRTLASVICVPVQFYGPQTDIPERAGEIVDALKKLLAEDHAISSAA